MAGGVAVGRFDEAMFRGSFATFSRVVPATDRKTSAKVALKKFADCELNTAVRELWIVAHSQVLPPHPHILPGMVSVIDQQGTVAIVSPWMASDLQSYADQKGCIVGSELRSITTQILGGLAHCHAHGVVHRDVKLSNLLIDHTGRVLLSDFGSAAVPRRSGGGGDTPCVGTTPMQSPEVLCAVRSAAPAVDIWGAGVAVAELSRGGDRLFSGCSSVDVFVDILAVIGAPSPDGLGPEDEERVHKVVSFLSAGTPPLGIATRLPALLDDGPAISVISTMLSASPKDRPSAAALLDSEWLCAQGMAEECKTRTVVLAEERETAHTHESMYCSERERA
eukprot:Hpha_TRINITY_DN15889_c3_g3::TRINITY_DN15889_c3_g3_i2::g.191426::m.191426